VERQLALRRRLISTGSRPIGWKAAFGAPEWLQRLGLDGPVVGFLTDASVIPDGGEVAIGDWTRPVAEPELAVHLGLDIPMDSDDAGVRAALAAVAPAIELADVDLPPDDLEKVVSRNVFHRAVILGELDPGRRGGDIAGLEARVRIDGVEVAHTGELEDLTGEVVQVVGHLSRLLAEHGETMHGGDVVICGSVVPPLQLEPGSTVEYELRPMRPISVSVL
jgi:2-keto-4-pentenoate hydratase